MLSWLAVAFSVLGVGSFYVHPPPGRHHHLMKPRDWSAEHIKNPGRDLVWPWSLNTVEEIGDKEIYHWTESDVVEKFQSDKDLLLHLPGGCELTTEQYKRLQDFRRGAHYVQHCYCQEGAVYCKLKQGEQHVQIT